jgi:hypothetical protein
MQGSPHIEKVLSRSIKPILTIFITIVGWKILKSILSTSPNQISEGPIK